MQQCTARVQHCNYCLWQHGQVGGHGGTRALAGWAPTSSRMHDPPLCPVIYTTTRPFNHHHHHRQPYGAVAERCLWRPPPPYTNTHLHTIWSIPPEISSQGRCALNATLLAMLLCAPRMLLNRRRARRSMTCNRTPTLCFRGLGFGGAERAEVRDLPGARVGGLQGPWVWRVRGAGFTCHRVFRVFRGYRGYSVCICFPTPGRGLPYGSGLGLSRCLGPGECLHSFIQGLFVYLFLFG